MGKKVISKKHKFHKDLPINKKQKTEKKEDINKAPKNPDDQEIPQIFNRVSKIIKAKNNARKLRNKQKKILSQKEANNGFNIQRKKNKQNMTEDDLIDTADFLEKDNSWYPHNGRPLEPIPTLKQYPNESFRFFKQRVKAVTDAVLSEAQFQEKFNVDVVRNEVGDVVNVVKVQDKQSQMKKLKAKERRLKWKLKKHKSKLVNNSDDEDDIDAVERKLFRNEKIEFGDIVHRPPSLQTDKLDNLLKSKKDEKNFLFLQSLRKETASNQHKKPSQIKKEAMRNLEAERVAAIQAYRQLKLKKKTSIEKGMIT